jgi:uncharacterized protein (DUF952 family)
MPLIYKIVPAEEWQAAQKTGVFQGSAIDLKDGYIHFSSAPQLRETARRHFPHLPDLVLLAVEAKDLGDSLKWEVSRGGDLFPHLYAELSVGLVRSATPLPVKDGSHEFPAGIP